MRRHIYFVYIYIYIYIRCFGCIACKVGTIEVGNWFLCVSKVLYCIADLISFWNLIGSRLGHGKHCDIVIKVLLVLQLGKLWLRSAVFVHIVDLRIDGFCE